GERLSICGFFMNIHRVNTAWRIFLREEAHRVSPIPKLDIRLGRPLCVSFPIGRTIGQDNQFGWNLKAGSKLHLPECHSSPAFPCLPAACRPTEKRLQMIPCERDCVPDSAMTRVPASPLRTGSSVGRAQD